MWGPAVQRAGDLVLEDREVQPIRYGRWTEGHFVPGRVALRSDVPGGSSRWSSRLRPRWPLTEDRRSSGVAVASSWSQTAHPRGGATRFSLPRTNCATNDQDESNDRLAGDKTI